MEGTERIPSGGTQQLKSALEIKTGCRVHFGLAELCRTAEYCHAGLGLALAEPGYRLRIPLDVSLANTAGGDEYERRIQDACSTSGLGHPVEILEALPLHCGLGAGTQLGVAIAAASLLAQQEKTERQAYQWQPLPTEEADWSEENLANLSARGKRSAIGLHAFLHGGFVVDQGRGGGSQRHFCCNNYRLPDSWRVILATPTQQTGASGARESALMVEIASSPNPHAPTMLSLMDSISKVANAPSPSFEVFTGQLTEYMRLASTLFFDAQGGMYNGDALSAVACTLKSVGASAVGQSSWGPTIFGFADSEQSAQEIVHRFGAVSPVADCSIQVSLPAQQGAVWRAV